MRQPSSSLSRQRPLLTSADLFFKSDSKDSVATASNPSTFHVDKNKFELFANPCQVQGGVEVGELCRSLRALFLLAREIAFLFFLFAVVLWIVFFFFSFVEDVTLYFFLFTYLSLWIESFAQRRAVIFLTVSIHPHLRKTRRCQI